MNSNSIEDLTDKTLDWARERNFFNQATKKGQIKKSIEEIKETQQAVYNDNFYEIKDGIGDTLVTMIILTELFSSPLIDFKSIYESVAKHNYKPRCTNYCLIREAFQYTKEIKFLIEKDDDFEKSVRACFELVLKRLLQLANSYDLYLEDCLKYAYNEIKDRKGKFIDGQYVKEEGLNE